MTEFFASIPIWWAKVAAIGIFLGVLLAAWLLPRSGGILSQNWSARWKDLRWWATLLLVIQLALYWIF